MCEESTTTPRYLLLCNISSMLCRGPCIHVAALLGKIPLVYSLCKAKVRKCNSAYQYVLQFWLKISLYPIYNKHYDFRNFSCHFLWAVLTPAICPHLAGGKGDHKFQQPVQLRDYFIHTNKHPGHLDKSFLVGAYLFQYLLHYGPNNGWFGLCSG